MYVNVLIVKSSVFQMSHKMAKKTPPNFLLILTMYIVGLLQDRLYRDMNDPHKNADIFNAGPGTVYPEVM